MDSIYNVIATVVIPFLVQGLKKIVPTKYAPIAVVVLAVIYVTIARAMNLDPNLQEVAAMIATVLGVSGVSVLGYDIFKKTILDK